MEAAAGEAQGVDLRLAFDCRLKLEFHGTKVTSDGGLLACRELDDALGLSETAGEVLTDTRTGANGIDVVHARRPVRGIVLDMDSSVSPTYGEHAGSAYN